ncbi:hypothetical protein, partial [Phascolarctobacterium faecium]|uniref:hypothetical protein n=1 Tax=Phascolarctobacterium faecium TaxID=33025 RepID=UPI003AEFF36D
GKCLCGKIKNPRKAGILGQYLAGRLPRRCAVNAPKQACFSRRQGQCAGTVRSGVAYNFCIEGKTSLLVRWAFHLCEPCDVGICVKKKEYQLVVLLKREN